MRRVLAGIALAIAVAATLAYAPVLGNGFTNFDDDAYVTDNVMVRDGSRSGRRGGTRRPSGIFRKRCASGRGTP